MTDKRNLWQRGNQWYFKLHIPRPLQRHFPTSTGKTKSHLIVALGDSLSQAKLLRDRRVAAAGGVFARLRAGEVMSPEQIKVALNLDLKGIAEQSYAETLQIMPIWFRRLAEKYQLLPDDELYQMKVEQICKQHGVSVPPLNSDAYKEIVAHIVQGQRGAQADTLSDLSKAAHPTIEPQPEVVPEGTTSETISQAAEAWFTELQRAGRRQNTIIGHRQHVQAFVKRCGDLPLTSIKRAMASDFLDNLAAGGLVNRTVNQYNVTLFCVFKSAKKRGRFTGENPFEDQHREVNEEINRPPFEDPELQTLFDALPRREIKPARHSPKTALPWVSLIGLFSGMRIEEISQLKAEDIRVESTNGGTTTVIDIHNGEGYHLKTKSTPRLVPVHSALVHAGLLDYVAALPKGSMLFPGLTRSKDGKIGKQVGDLFKRKLKALGLREGLCFHSLRHTVGDRLRKAGIPEDDRAALLGHKNKHITSRVYGHGGPGLKRLAGMVEALQYPGLKI